jgi:Putative Ig domain
MIRQPSSQSSGIISVSVPKDMATAGSGFSFPLPSQIANTAVGSNAVISVTTITGQPIPAWLTFDSQTKTFFASSVPDGAFPLQVVVTIDGSSTTIVISERAQ